MTHATTIMPAPSIPIARIRGSLGEKVLRKSPELFNQSLPTVLAEVLQNARRAGATHVAIEHFGEEGQATLVVRDDGHGIADMGKLVTFGASAWDERTDLAENAAGMGVYSLASRGVTVRSLGRRVTLNRAVFCGEADAAVLPDPEMDAGTELTFPVSEKGVPYLVERACRFYPLPVTLNGQPLGQRDFLAAAEHVVEWQGLRLGVFREPGPQVLDLFDRHRGWSSRLYLNFHGHVVECGTAVALAEVGGPTRSVFVDVMSAPDLRLVLPARNEPIDNDFFRAMRARAERALLEAVARQSKHALAFADAKRAERLGIILPPVEIALSPWRMVSGETRSRLDRVEAPVVLGTDGTEVLLADGVRWGEACDQTNLHRLLLGWQDGARVMEANPRFAGYPAYDALRVVREVSAVAVGADGVTEELAPPDSGVPPVSFEDDRRVVETVRARLMVQNGGHSPGVPTLLHEAAVPFFFTSEAFGDAFPGFVVARGTAPGDLADALVEGFFAHSDDGDADSYDRQLECFTADALDTARGLLLDNDAAVAARIVDALRDARWVLRTLGTGRIELQITESQVGSTIRIVNAAGKEVTAVL
ncbi:ATP-binding protein [Roseomonas mucosa]